MKAFVALLMVLSATALADDEYKPLKGDWALNSPTLMDPPATEQKDRVSLEIESEAAKQIYLTIDSPARRDLCGEGGWIKQAGGLLCTNDAQRGTIAAMSRSSSEGQTRGRLRGRWLADLAAVDRTLSGSGRLNAHDGEIARDVEIARDSSPRSRSLDGIAERTG